jgi:hypothetical protein
MYERTSDSIVVSHPVRGGVIADISNLQKVLEALLRKNGCTPGFVRNNHFYLSVPTDISEVEKRAYFFLWADENFRFLGKVGCDLGNLAMFEDLRLLKYGNSIQASGTEVSLGRNGFRMASIDFDLIENLLHAGKVCVFPVAREKNYMPVEDGRGIFVSDLMLNSLNVVSTSNPGLKTMQRCRGLVQYRGSSPLLRYRDGYVALVHMKRKNVYSNAFAFFDKALLQCRISDEFTVFSDVSSINFCCGMAVEGDEAILPVCVHDRLTYLFRLPLEDFSKTARWRDLNRC